MRLLYILVLIYHPSIPIWMLCDLNMCLDDTAFWSSYKCDILIIFHKITPKMKTNSSIVWNFRYSNMTILLAPLAGINICYFLYYCSESDFAMLLSWPTAVSVVEVILDRVRSTEKGVLEVCSVQTFTWKDCSLKSQRLNMDKCIH
jgi:hypothetical protein